VCAQLQETLTELLRKLHGQLTNKETLVGDDFCYLSHNCPFEKTIFLTMVSNPQFYPQASMHSNNENFLVEFVGKMRFRVQTQTKPMTL
jgi:hypothetical protein